MATPWKTTVEVEDLHNDHRAGKLKISQVAGALADRLKANVYASLLQPEIEALRKVKRVARYDKILKSLYDFGDINKRIWFGSF